MGVVNLDDIEPGMILCRDITNRTGLVLLKAGDQITEKHLRILRMWGITEADIKGLEKEEVLKKAAEKIDPSVLQEVEKRVDETFLHTDHEHPFIKELLRLVKATTIRRLS